MTQRLGRGLAIGLWIVAVALLMAQVLLPVLAPQRLTGNSDSAIGLVILGMLGMATTGALVAERRPGQPLGWLLLVIGLSALVAGTTTQFAFALFGPLPAQPGTGFLLLVWVSDCAWFLALGLLVTFLLLLYPTGSLLSVRWRPVAWLEGVLLAALLLATAFGPWDPSANYGATNPLAVPALQWFPVDSLLVTLPLVLLVNLSALALRYRRGSMAERQQIKWFLYPVGLLLLASLGQALLRISNVPPTTLQQQIENLVFVLGYLLIPIAIGIAILRHQLFDIDLIIRKTLVYTLLTALLALVYFGSVVVLQGLFGSLTGEEQSPLVPVVSTLAIAALFTPLHRRIQDTIDRRFYRQKYDAQQVLAQLAATARQAGLGRLDSKRNCRIPFPAL